MIVVTGATGHLGRLVIEALLKKVPAREIAGAARNPDKAKDLAARGVEVRRADYSKPETLRTALADADKLLLVSSSEVGRRASQHAAVVQAAKKAGVKLLAYTSILRAETSSIALAAEHKATERTIRASGLPYVFLRNGWYLSSYAVRREREPVCFRPDRAPATRPEPRSPQGDRSPRRLSPHRGERAR